MPDAKVMNGRSKITPRDHRLAGLVPHGIPEADLPSNRGHARGTTERDGQHPVYDRHPPRAYRPSPGGHKSNGKTNGASIWSAGPVADSEGIRAKLRASYQGLERHAKRALGHARMAWVWCTEMGRTAMSNKWVRWFDLAALAAFVIVVLVARWV
jgi:hypothetical protein